MFWHTECEECFLFLIHYVLKIECEYTWKMVEEEVFPTLMAFTTAPIHVCVVLALVCILYSRFTGACSLIASVETLN